MKLVTRLKERPSRSSSLAALILDRWSSTSGRESHRGDRPWPGTQCWHVTGSPDVRAIFRIPLRPMEHSQPISIQRAACSKPHSRHRLRDNGSATRAEALLVNDELVQRLPELGNRAGARGKRVWTPITGCLATGESAAWDQSRFALSRCAARVIPLLGGEPRQRPCSEGDRYCRRIGLSNELA